ncbi:MAG: hypothetical protein AAFO95_01075 [Cyanobacteria bacterium J06600_6]
MKLDLAKFSNSHRHNLLISKLSRLFYLTTVIYLTLVNAAISAPENFNPNLESTPETEVERNIGDRGDRRDETETDKIPVKPQPQVVPQTPKVKTPQVTLPTPTLSNESSIESGTADIELKTKPDNNLSIGSSILDVDNLTFDFQLDFDNFGQTNLTTKQQIDFNLYNLDFVFETGVNLFKQDEIETVNNIPLYLSWLTTIGKTDITITGGVDLFDRLAAVPRFSLKASRPLFSSVTADGKLKSLFVLSAQAQYQAYKFNAETLENEIDVWRFTPSIYWQIIPNLSLFTLGQYGTFNDRNQELQSFSRLEKKLGSFSIAANLFTWNFESDLSETSGYFSPTDFMVYNGELGWQGTMFNETLDCKLSAAFGKQTLEGSTDNAWTYKALCGANLLDNVELDLGYTYSNVRDRSTGNTSFSNQSIKGTLNIEL